MPKHKRARKRLSGYQFFYHSCLKELKLKSQNSSTSIKLPLVSTNCAQIWKNTDNDTKTRFQEEADKVNTANMRPPKPKRQPKVLKKTPNGTKKRVQVKAVNKAKTGTSPKPQHPSTSLKKTNKNRSRDQSKMLKKKKIKFERPVSAFIHFACEFRSVEKRNHPEYTFGQISRVLSEMWRNADEETKQKYKRLSLNQSERYRKEKRSKSAGRSME